MATETITLSQLSEHNTPEDLWIAVYGKVYNLTAFAMDHPGGVEILNECAGTDGTESFDYVGHSEGAMDKVRDCVVGVLEDQSDSSKSSTPPQAVIPNPVAPAASSSSSSLSIFSRLPLLLFPTVLLAGVYYFSSTTHVSAWRTTGIPLPGLKLSGGGNTGYSFLGGIVLASSLSGVGWAFLYSQFHKTLESEKEVFSYPSVIPRKRVGK